MRNLLFLITATLAAQSIPDQVLKIIEANKSWTLEQQRSICEIPAPPFKETVRGVEKTVTKIDHTLGLILKHMLEKSP